MRWVGRSSTSGAASARAGRGVGQGGPHAKVTGDQAEAEEREIPPGIGEVPGMDQLALDSFGPHALVESEPRTERLQVLLLPLVHGLEPLDLIDKLGNILGSLFELLDILLCRRELARERRLLFLEERGPPGERFVIARWISTCSRPRRGPSRPCRTAPTNSEGFSLVILSATASLKSRWPAADCSISPASDWSDSVCACSRTLS